MIQLKQKKAIVIITLSLLVLFGTGIGYYLLSPSSMVAIDVNPSIEIHTNRLGEVVSIDPVNDDAIQLMTGYQLTDRNLESVIQDIVDRMILNGYLVNKKTDELLISADQNSNSDALLSRVETAFQDYLQEKQIDVTLFDQKVDMKDSAIKIAHENKVSVGKMALIDKLKAYSNGAEISDFTGDTVKELVQYAKDHNISLGKIIKRYHEAIGGQSTPTSAADVVTPSVVPTPDALSDDTTITISTDKDSKLEDAKENSDLRDTEKADSGIIDRAKKHKDSKKVHIKKSGKFVKDREDADNDDSVDAVTGATIKSDQEDRKDIEDSDTNENEDNYLKEDNEDNDYQEKEDRNQVENSQNEDEDGYSHGDEGDDD